MTPEAKHLLDAIADLADQEHTDEAARASLKTRLSHDGFERVVSSIQRLVGVPGRGGSIRYWAAVLMLLPIPGLRTLLLNNLGKVVAPEAPSEKKDPEESPQDTKTLLKKAMTEVGLKSFTSTLDELHSLVGASAPEIERAILMLRTSASVLSTHSDASMIRYWAMVMRLLQIPGVFQLCTWPAPKKAREVEPVIGVPLPSSGQDSGTVHFLAEGMSVKTLQGTQIHGPCKVTMRADGSFLVEDLPAEMSGAELIAQERARQISEEGWSPEHDDAHTDGELALAAACYAVPIECNLRRLVWAEDAENPYGQFLTRDPWPWDKTWDKRPGPGCNSTDRLRSLIKAGALIAAEIDRITRMEPVPTPRARTADCEVYPNGIVKPVEQDAERNRKLYAVRCKLFGLWQEGLKVDRIAGSQDLLEEIFAPSDGIQATAWTCEAHGEITLLVEERQAKGVLIFRDVDGRDLASLNTELEA